MNYKEEYKKCLTNFNYWLKHYVKFIEYNTDTSVRHSNRSDDIVRAKSNKEDLELQNKEFVR